MIGCLPIWTGKDIRHAHKITAVATERHTRLVAGSGTEEKAGGKGRVWKGMGLRTVDQRDDAGRGRGAGRGAIHGTVGALAFNVVSMGQRRDVLHKQPHLAV